MAYKYSVGERKFGDIKAQNDAEGDTLIDFDENCIILTTGGERRIKISGSTGDITFNESYTFPNSDGTYGQVLATDGSGSLSWQDMSGGGEEAPSGGDSSEIQSGTWTPGLDHGYSLSGTPQGRYQRVGDQVTVWFKFNVGTANNTATQAMKITGLPFTASSDNGIRSTGPQPHGVSFTTITYIQDGESAIRFMDQTLTSAKQIANFASEGAVRGNITYWIG
jgi:hypothetical protein